MRFHLKLSGLWAAAGLMIGLSVAQVQAEVLVFDCALGQRTNTYYQPESLKVTVNPDRWSVQVEDDLTRKIQKTPIVGKVETMTSQRLTMTWLMPGLPRDPKSHTRAADNLILHQRLTIKPDGSGTLVGNVNMSGYGNRAEVRSTVICKRLK